MNPEKEQKKQDKRLRKLQESIAAYAEGSRDGLGYSDNITVADLLLLLEHEPLVRKLIARIAASQPGEPPDGDLEETAPETAPGAEEEAGQSGASAAPPIQPEPPGRSLPPLFSALSPARPAAPDPLRAELALLAALQADAPLARLLLGEGAGSESEARQLLRLAARAAQWNNMLALWDELAARCKQQQAPASAMQQQALQTALALHNLCWQDRRAALQEASAGQPYDYERHQRATPRGEQVRAQWLPGLISAGGSLERKPLVETA